MSRALLLSLGDRYGVGPELVAAHLGRLGGERRTGTSPILVVGDQRVLRNGAASAGAELDIASTSSPVVPGDRGWALLDRPFDAPVAPLGEVSRAAGEETLAVLRLTADLAASRAIDGFVYAPFNKSAMRLAGHEAGDELDYIEKLMEPAGLVGEINILGDLWTSRVTSHVPLRDVADNINEAAVDRAIDLIAGALRDAGRSDPKIAVAALNPHAGENGAFGREEIDVIAPAVADAVSRGVNAVGPVPADTVFPRAQSEGFDAVVTMFHDQGQIALKLLGLGQGVTLLAGLPVPVATPGHGTAYDIAGKGIARGDGLSAAVALVETMMKRRTGT